MRREVAGKMTPTVLVIGTLDTKGEELKYLCEEIERAGFRPLVMDVGVLGKPAFKADIVREEVIAKGGGDIQSLSECAAHGSSRGNAVDILIRGGTAICKDLLDRNSFDGVVSVGGGTGTNIATSIMKALPFGIPKVMLSTLPCNVKDTTKYFGRKDITMISCVVDLVGLNGITRSAIQHAAGAITGMASLGRAKIEKKKSVLMTCLGITTPAVMAVRQRLVDCGREVIVLHKRTEIVDLLVEEKLLEIEAFIDMTPNELVDYVVYPGGRFLGDRLSKVLDSGIPYIFVPGGLDIILLLLSAENIPETLKGRKYKVHTPSATLVRTNPEELYRMGRAFAEMAKRAKGPVKVLVPMRGLSAMDAENSDFHDFNAIGKFLDGLKEGPGARLDVRNVICNINDAVFTDAVMDAFMVLSRRAASVAKAQEVQDGTDC